MFSPSLFESTGDLFTKQQLEREFGINASQTCIYGSEKGEGEGEEDEEDGKNRRGRDKDRDNGSASATRRRSNPRNTNNNNDDEDNENNNKKRRVKGKVSKRFSIPSSRFNKAAAAAEGALLHRNFHFNLMNCPEEEDGEGEGEGEGEEQAT